MINNGLGASLSFSLIFSSYAYKTNTQPAGSWSNEKDINHEILIENLSYLRYVVITGSCHSVKIKSLSWNVDCLEVDFQESISRCFGTGSI